ncbi:hypothetical protein DXC99_05325 [Collinsella sp. TF10-11AT]|nr:hypothetical protein [Collinsella sp. TF10-11AT]RGK62591.1 hypothetical protein DXC99_05325 [Collinsella sp. TF10-11AT]
MILLAVLAISAIALELIAVGVINLPRQQILSIHLASPFATSGRHVRMSAVPKVAIDDGRHAVFFPEIAPGVGADVAFTVEQPAHRFVAKRPAGDGLIAKAVEPAHDLGFCLAGSAHVKGHAHACCLMLVDGIVSICATVIPKD